MRVVDKKSLLAIRIDMRSSGVLQVSRRRSYAPLTNPRSSSRGRRNLVVEGNLWYLHSWPSGFAACCDPPAVHRSVLHLPVSLMVGRPLIVVPADVPLPAHICMLLAAGVSQAPCMPSATKCT